MIFKLTGFIGCLLLIAAVNTYAGKITALADFDRLKNASGQLPVLVTFKTANHRTAASVSPGNTGDWLALGSYIEAVTAQGLNELGWINFNDYLVMKTLPVVARSVTREALGTLLATDSVESIVEDVIREQTLTQSTQAIGLPQNQAASFGGKGVSVAVIDSGVDNTHPFIKGKVLAGLCVSARKRCPGGKTMAEGIGAGAPACDKKCSHGTHVAGIIAGNSQTRKGVAPDAKLTAVRVLGADGRGSDGAILVALEWVLLTHKKYNTVAVNMSLGGGKFTNYCDHISNGHFKTLINRLKAEGVAVIIASGNEARKDKDFKHAIAAPACVSSAISVGALNRAGTAYAAYSNTYKKLSIMAPGGDLGVDAGIVSSITGGRFEGKQGTSMAAPHVAGAWAVLKSAQPKAGYQDIMNALTGAHIPRYKDSRNGLSFPVLNVNAAMRLANPVPVKVKPGPDVKQPTKPKPEKPKPEKPKNERIDGIFIDRSGSDNDEKIDW